MAKAKTTLHRMRDYAIEEPSFTAAFAAWELGIHPGSAHNAVAELLKLGIIEEIEPRSGPYAAVYRYRPIEEEPNGMTPKQRRRLFGELDDARAAGVGIEAQPRGVVVPHTRIEGVSHSPGRDRRRQERGVRLARGKGKGPKAA